MKDRIPQYPGRAKMTLPDGSFKYITLERADEAVEQGTPLNKSTLLTDETATALGLDPSSNPTVNDALLQTLVNLAAVDGKIPSDAAIQLLINNGVATHNQSTAAHSDIRASVTNAQNALQGNINSVQTTLQNNINNVNSTLTSKVNTVNSDLLSKITATNNTISGLTKCAVGVYAGTGTSAANSDTPNQDNMTVLNFTFVPKFLRITRINTTWDYLVIFPNNLGENNKRYVYPLMSYNGGTVNTKDYCSVWLANNKKTIKLAADTSYNQLNVTGYSYLYIALG